MPLSCLKVLLPFRPVWNEVITRLLSPTLARDTRSRGHPSPPAVRHLQEERSSGWKTMHPALLATTRWVSSIPGGGDAVIPRTRRKRRSVILHAICLAACVVDARPARLPHAYTILVVGTGSVKGSYGYQGPPASCISELWTMKNWGHEAVAFRLCMHTRHQKEGGVPEVGPG